MSWLGEIERGNQQKAAATVNDGVHDEVLPALGQRPFVLAQAGPADGRVYRLPAAGVPETAAPAPDRVDGGVRPAPPVGSDRVPYVPPPRFVRSSDLDGRTTSGTLLERAIAGATTLYYGASSFDIGGKAPVRTWANPAKTKFLRPEWTTTPQGKALSISWALDTAVDLGLAQIPNSTGWEIGSSWKTIAVDTLSPALVNLASRRFGVIGGLIAGTVPHMLEKLALERRPVRDDD